MGAIINIIAHKALLTDINTSYIGKVKMGNGDIVKAVGRGTLIIEPKKGRRHIKEVILGLDKNLLNVGQMMEHRYFLLFSGKVVEIYDDRSNCQTWLLRLK